MASVNFRKSVGICLIHKLAPSVHVVCSFACMMSGSHSLQVGNVFTSKKGKNWRNTSSRPSFQTKLIVAYDAE